MLAPVWKEGNVLALVKFWCCIVEGTSGGLHHKHSSLQSAVEEAERLQRLSYNKDKKVYVMELVSYCEIAEPEPPILWHKV